MKKGYHQGRHLVKDVGMEPSSSEAWMAAVVMQQCQQAEEHQGELQHLADQPGSMLDQLMAAQVQTSQQLWDHGTQVVRPALSGTAAEGSDSNGCPTICMPKVTPKDGPETFLNSFKLSAWVLEWLENQWMVILSLCLVGHAQQVVDTLAPEEVTDYGQVQEAILQMLNLSTEATGGVWGK